MKVSLIKYFFTPAPGIVCLVNIGIGEQNYSAAILCYRNQMGQFLRTNPTSSSSSSICKLFPFKPLNGLLGLFCTLWFWVPLEASKWEHELFTYFGEDYEKAGVFLRKGWNFTLFLLKPLHIPQPIPLPTPSLPHQHDLPIYALNLV